VAEAADNLGGIARTRPKALKVVDGGVFMEKIEIILKDLWNVETIVCHPSGW
jgi:hypothetical protein